MVRVCNSQLKGRWFKSIKIQEISIGLLNSTKFQKKIGFSSNTVNLSPIRPSILTKWKKTFTNVQITGKKFYKRANHGQRIEIKKLSTTGRSRAFHRGQRFLKKLLTTGRSQNREETSIATRGRERSDGGILAGNQT